MFEAGFFVETFLPLFMLSAYKNFVHGNSIEPRSEADCEYPLDSSPSEREISIIKSW